MDIENDMRRWAAWARGGVNLGVKPLAMLDDGKRDTVAYMPMSDDEAALFDPAVATLKQIDKELYNYVRLHYIYGMSVRAVAIVAGSNRATVHHGIITAKTFINGFMCGKHHEAAKNAVLSLTE